MLNQKEIENRNREALSSSYEEDMLEFIKMIEKPKPKFYNGANTRFNDFAYYWLYEQENHKANGVNSNIFIITKYASPYIGDCSIGDITTNIKRRKKGEGSIRFNQKTKKWEARFSYGICADGKRDRRSRVANTKADAEKLIKEMKLEANKLCEEAMSSGNITIEKYCEEWLKGKVIQLKPTSYDRIECTFKNQVSPYIGMMQLNDVKADHLQNIVYNLIEKKYSYSSIKKMYNLLNECFRDAEIRGDIAKSPMAGVKMPKKHHECIPPTKEMIPFSTDEIQMLIGEATRKHSTGKYVYRLGWLFIFMLCTGIRVGEALALKYSDIDWEKNTIHICRNAQSVINRKSGERRYETRIFENVKTKSSNRYIGLNTTALAALNALQEITGNCEFIASNQKGHPVTYGNFLRSFKDLLKTLRLQQRELHNLRHTFATQLFAKKVDIKIISELLGHSSIQITYDTYVHVSDDEKHNAIQSIDFIKIHEPQI